MIEHQLELPLNKPRDATPEEVQQWMNEELAPQAKYSLHTVVIASIIQLCAFGFMLSAFWMIDKMVN